MGVFLSLVSKRAVNSSVNGSAIEIKMFARNIKWDQKTAMKSNIFSNLEILRGAFLFPLTMD